ncbi:hypothetical protein ACE6H2_023189 [Prunus campanulata]
MALGGDGGRRNTTALIVRVSASFLFCFSAANQPCTNRKSSSPLVHLASSAVFPLQGNVYPLGYYSLSLNIGRPAKIFELDIDSGNDLTQVQCDAPCTGCTKCLCLSPVHVHLPPREHLYRPNNNLLQCEDLLCTVKYADHGSSLGVLVREYFPLKFTNGSLLSPHLAFGHWPGNGKVSIVSQLSHLGLTRNVVGHCLSGQGGGFLCFGADLVPSSGVIWTSMPPNSMGKWCTSGPAELVFGGKATSVKGLNMIFDSGSSYTYFNSQAYQAIVTLVRNDLEGKPLKDATEDQSLPICWKGRKPFKFVCDAKNYYKPLARSFTNAKNVQLQLSTEAYLVVTVRMVSCNVCLGIFNGMEVGLANLNTIGDTMLAYDNKNRRTG